MAITFLRSTGGAIGTASSQWGLTWPAGFVTTGMDLVLGLGCNSSAASVSTITDNVGTIYLRAVAMGTGRPVAGAELWYAQNVSSLSTRVTVSWSASSSGVVAASAWSGFSTANALLTTASTAINVNSTTHDCGEVAPSQSSAVVISFGRLNASTGGAITNDPSLTTWVSTTASAPRCHGMYWIQGAASTSRGRFTTSSNCQHSGVVAVFSDTNTVVPGGWWSPLCLMGVQ